MRADVTDRPKFRNSQSINTTEAANKKRRRNQNQTAAAFYNSESNDNIHQEPSGDDVSVNQY